MFERKKKHTVLKNKSYRLHTQLRELIKLTFKALPFSKIMQEMIWWGGH